jgi:hypothetical protein
MTQRFLKFFTFLKKIQSNILNFSLFEGSVVIYIEYNEKLFVFLESILIFSKSSYLDKESKLLKNNFIEINRK